MVFRYKGINEKGKTVRGEIEAETRKEAMADIREEGVRVLSISEKKSLGIKSMVDSFVEKDYLGINRVLGRKKRKKQLSSLEEELELMGYSERDVANMLKGYTEDNFSVDKFSEEVLSLSTIQVEKIRLGRKSIMDDGGSGEGGVDSKFNLGVSVEELVTFTEQLSILLSTDVELVDALETVQVNMTNKKFITIVDLVLYDLTKGSGFSESLEKHPKVFDNLYVSMVRVGESTGSELPSTLDDMVRFLKMKVRLKKEVKKAMIYPAFIGVTMIGLLFFLNFFIIPKLKEVFISMDFELPLLTQIIFKISENTGIFLGITVVVLLVIVLMFWKVRYTRDIVKGMWDRLAVKLPVLRTAMVTMLMYQLTLTMSITLRNGIDVTESLELTNKVVGNRYLKKDIEKVYYDLEKGISISEAFGDKEYVTSIVKTAMSSGEKTGRLGETLDKVSSYYEVELESTLDALVAFIVPMSIFILACLVGPFVIGVYLPIATLTEQLGSM